VSWATEGSWFDFRLKQKAFSLSITSSRSAVGPTQLHGMGTGNCPARVKLQERDAEYSPAYSAEVKKMALN
jgi:hypothetical protein